MQHQCPQESQWRHQTENTMELKMIMLTHQESHTLHRHGINHREHVTIKIQDDCTDGGETQGIFYGYLRWLS